MLSVLVVQNEVLSTSIVLNKNMRKQIGKYADTISLYCKCGARILKPAAGPSRLDKPTDMFDLKIACNDSPPKFVGSRLYF